MARILISASHKSSGKTTISVGLGAAMTARGLSVQAFKKGPDYIDPMWHARATGRSCFNLDFNTQTHAEILSTLARRAVNADISLIEGNMGLHDGVDVEGSDSSAALARLIGAPVVLVVDCEGMARGIAALLVGFQSFEPDVRIGGVILNRTAGSRQQGKIRGAIERYSDIPVLGALSRASELTILERHLGLATPEETEGGDDRIEMLRRAVVDNIDVDRVIEIARSASPLAGTDWREPGFSPSSGSGCVEQVVIAVARDSAFGFYYPDDLEALERAGARLVFFSPLADAKLPAADALFIGGGFPETHMAELERNGTLRSAVRSAAAGGLPIYAECGGLMYLSRSIRWGNEERAMAGVIEADVVMHARPQGRGLVKVAATAAHPWHGDVPQPAALRPFAAHEFHYAALTNVPPDTTFAFNVLRGHGVDGSHDGIVSGNVLATFTHQRDTEANRWAECFVGFVRGVKAGRTG
ncbi:MAG: cobyrinate a,c-diamide synthase [Alphaproteobacteria bacterium]|nr:cobyrinate a,c-diamide synthase [Alphaproteobacteria bacterium]